MIDLIDLLKALEGVDFKKIILENPILSNDGKYSLKTIAPRLTMGHPDNLDRYFDIREFFDNGWSKGWENCELNTNGIEEELIRALFGSKND